MPSSCPQRCVPHTPDSSPWQSAAGCQVGSLVNRVRESTAGSVPPDPHPPSMGEWALFGNPVFAGVTEDEATVEQGDPARGGCPYRKAIRGQTLKDRRASEH